MLRSLVLDQEQVRFDRGSRLRNVFAGRLQIAVDKAVILVTTKKLSIEPWSKYLTPAKHNQHIRDDWGQSF